MIDRNNKYHKRREWAIDILGGRCVKCGSTDNLEFDHIDHALVSFRIGGSLLYSNDKLLPELMKCQLLCHKCHMDKTLHESGRKRCEHGYSGYVNRKCRCDICTDGWGKYFKTKRKSRRMYNKVGSI